MFFLLHIPLCSGGDTRATELSLLSSELSSVEDEEGVEEAKEPSTSLSDDNVERFVSVVDLAFPFLSKDARHAESEDSPDELWL